MVKTEPLFLIDGALLIEKVHRAFLGCTLMTHAGRDSTMVFGCLRDFLRLRGELGMTRGALVFGSRSYALTVDEVLRDLLGLFKKLGVACVHAPLKDELQLAGGMSAEFSVIVTADRRFLQLSTHDCEVILTKTTGQLEYERMPPETVKLAFGATPDQIPTYLALTEGPSDSVLTAQQAIRLITMFGDLASVYGKLSRVASVETRTKLEQCEAAIRGRFTAGVCSRAGLRKGQCVEPASFADVDTKENREILKLYGFYSLVPLLPYRSNSTAEVLAMLPKADTFQAIVDRMGMAALESRVRTSKICAIDAESDDKDPRTGTLLGMAFAVKPGEAYFLPLAENLPKEVSSGAAVNALRRIFGCDVDFIGHNIKYDYLLLRRIGIAIKRVHFDTMLAAFECHGDWPFFKLQYVAQRLLSLKDS